MSSTALSLRTVSVVRSDQRLLDGVSFSVPAGQPVVLLGHNGAGKTTLLRVAAGLMRTTDGALSVLGEPAPLGASVRRSVSVALDEPQFWPWMSAHRVIRTVADLSGNPPPDVSGLLAEVGLDGSRFALRRSKRVGKFSQGMRKRLQLACALAMPSRLLLIDEPTASLDADGAELVWAALERRVGAGVTVVVATHDRGATDRLGARALTLEAGRLVDDSAASQPAAVR